MGPEMVRRHKIQIVYAFGKEGPDFSKKFRGRDRSSVMLVRDLVVLAKKTLAGTTAEEDCAGAARTRKRWLFAEMRTDKSNPARRTLAAETQRAFCAIDFAIPGT
jgi:hypothetical protein